MTEPSRASEVLTIRVSAALGRRLTREATRRRRTRSEVARELLESALEGRTGDDDRKAEARRQSLLVRDRESERDTLEWILDAADFRGWE
ncbi:MAG: DUF3018 family protein [Acidobacteria bacterium]|nr:DUF3018 family protein [Acidobacteriota bacterium]